MIFSVFFSLLRKPAGRCPADCRFGGLCVSNAVFSAEKTSGKGERQLWLATPHQSPFGRQLPLKGKPFGGLRSSESLPLEGKVLSVAKRMRCSAPQSALSSFFSRSFRRSETAVPRGRNHTSSRQADHAVRDRARETGKKKSVKIIGASLLAAVIDTLLFLLACRNKPTKDWFSGGF